MKCEICKQKESTIHLSQTRQGKTTEHHFCEACAKVKGISLDPKDLIGNIGSLFGSGPASGGSVFDTTGGIPAFGASASKNIPCKSCGQSFDDFRRTGLFGCSRCYDAFSGQLDPVLRRVQGSTSHVGRKVCQTAGQQEEQLLRSRLTELKTTLQQAVQEEAYEKAARLRDEIHSLEKRLCVDEKEVMSK
jgi:protein arginine kinase activator